MAIKKAMDWSKLEGMLMFDAAKSVCADELKISEDTIERRIKQKHKMTFSEFKKKQLLKTVLRLKQKMIKKALSGDNVCLIFTLKNISDWKDKPDDMSKAQDIKISFSDAKLAKD